MERILVRSFLLACLVALNCLAQPFFFRKDMMVGQRPRAVIAGDFNGDGRLDLAADTEEGVFVLLNAGGGNFERPIRTEVTSGLFWLPAAADFNGDGKDDLVGSGMLFLSRGDGTFLPPRPLGDQEAVGAADFNGDGKMDLLITDGDWSSGTYITHGVRTLLGNGDGTFRGGVKVTAAGALQIRVADFNRDGRPDVAMLPASGDAPAGSTFLLVFLGQGDGTFSPEIRTLVQGTSDSASLTAFLIADFNGDKLPDVFTASGVRLGIGDGTFRSPVPYSGQGDGFPMAAADVTGDGYADLILGHGVRPGKGDGTFLPMLEQSVSFVSGYAFSLAVADLDGDGRVDLITANYDYNSVSALMAQAQGGPELTRAVSAAMNVALVSPGSLATLFVHTRATTASASPPWPGILGGISLMTRDSQGAYREAPLVSVSPTQITFQVPTGAALGEATLGIAGDAGETLGSMQVNAVAPTLFPQSANNSVPAAAGVLVRSDGTQVPLRVYNCNPELGCGLEMIPLSTAAGTIYLSFFGTGFGGASADDVTCSINGVNVPVVYAGPQATPGMDQVNIRLIPEILKTVQVDPIWGAAFATINFRVGGVPANSFYLWIE